MSVDPKVVGVPAVAFDELDPELRVLLAPRYERLGYLGEFFGRMAHQPEALGHFVRFTEAAKVAVDPNLAEVVALTVATRTGNDYERCQHERLAIRLDLGRTWVREVERLDPDAADLDDHERVVQRWVLAAVDSHGSRAAAEAAALADALGPDATVAVMLLCGRYVAHATIVNSLGIVAPVPSIFEDGFGRESDPDASGRPGEGDR